jgi:hypothetical protein
MTKLFLLNKIFFNIVKGNDVSQYLLTHPYTKSRCLAGFFICVR